MGVSARSRSCSPPLTALPTGGAPELVVVSGYSGIGKSSAVHELHKSARAAARAVRRQASPTNTSATFHMPSLAQALQGLIRPLLGKSDAELATWREAFGEALGPNGQLVVALIPEFELLTGPQSPLPELPPQDAQRRVQHGLPPPARRLRSAGVPAGAVPR